MSANLLLMFLLYHLLVHVSSSTATPLGSTIAVATRFDKRQSPNQFILSSRPLPPPHFKMLVNILDREVASLGYAASKAEPHWQSQETIPSLAGTVHAQLTSFPKRRQFMGLANDGQGTKIYAVPLFHQDFDRHRPIIGDFAGTGASKGSQRVLIVGVRKPAPLDLTLYRGPANLQPAKVEMYGLAQFDHAATFHFRLERPWLNRDIAESLEDVLRR
ncbi:ATP-dependent DNA helicase RecQ [Pseudozyma hubeiensis]|nr:ATP-dependent DNA helicase RecQ [Pseudozyma hubeiensis]KAJ9476093.1 ATP-dependent DNA helicase RecQ [Pseudozyma hubeiensis]KAJ9479886.1 ATP-dependent DNA helicase RecQ [Pseudozyma hubeiensis]